jgi:predicted nucleotidyltransferase
MGKVFTWNEIEQGAVPKLEHFTYVVEQLQRELAVTSSIETAVICGSVVRGDHNRRSDIDCVVIYDPMKERGAFANMQRLSALAAKWAVPLTFVPCCGAVAISRMHHLGPSFFAHIARSAQAGGVIKGWPPTLRQDMSKDAELESYLRVKLYSLQEQCAEFPAKTHEQQAHTLKKMLEAPLHVARKTLARISTLKGDSKASIRTQYAEEMPQKHADRLEDLLLLDAEYTRALEEQLKTPDKLEYDALFNYLAEHMVEVIAFVKLNALHIDHLPAP